jgi:hypothetical protein
MPLSWGIYKLVCLVCVCFKELTLIHTTWVIFRTSGMAQVVDRLLSKCEALISNPSNTQNNNKNTTNIGDCQVRFSELGCTLYDSIYMKFLQR